MADGINGETVKALREARGLTQRALARAADISVDAVQQYEAGRRTDPPVSVAVRLADALGVPVPALAAPLPPQPE